MIGWRDYMMRLAVTRLDLLFILASLLALILRLSYAVALKPTQRPPDQYKIVMALLALLHVIGMTKLLGAFEPVGVLLASIYRMMMQLRRVIVPYLMLFLAFSICFQLFDAPDGWLSPLYRFLEADDPESDKTHLLLLASSSYTIAIDLLILNLMIAIMTDTYFRVSRPAGSRKGHGLAIEAYRMSRVGLLNELLTRPVIPQPVDVLQMLTSLLFTAAAHTAKQVCAPHKPPHTDGGTSGPSSPAVDDSRQTSCSNPPAVSPESIRSNLDSGLPATKGAEEDAQQVSRAQGEHLADQKRRAQEEAEQQVFRALREHLADQRRRAHKEEAEQEASESIAEQQQQLRALIRESAEMRRLLLTQRDETLELQNLNEKVQQLLLERCPTSSRDNPRRDATEQEAGACQAASAFLARYVV